MMGLRTALPVPGAGGESERKGRKIGIAVLRATSRYARTIRKQETAPRSGLCLASLNCVESTCTSSLTIKCNSSFRPGRRATKMLILSIDAPQVLDV